MQSHIYEFSIGRGWNNSYFREECSKPKIYVEISMATTKKINKRITKKPVEEKIYKNKTSLFQKKAGKEEWRHKK